MCSRYLLPNLIVAANFSQFREELSAAQKSSCKFFLAAKMADTEMQLFYSKTTNLSRQDLDLTPMGLSAYYDAIFSVVSHCGSSEEADRAPTAQQPVGVIVGLVWSTLTLHFDQSESNIAGMHLCVARALHNM
jgi:hypothetical protein